MKTTDTQVVKITDVSSAPTYTVDDSDLSDDDTVDVIQANPNFDSLADDLTVSSGGGTTSVTLSASASDAAAGDYICQAGVTPVPQIPDVFHPVLVFALAAELLKVHGDAEGAKLEYATAEARARDAATMIQPRVEGRPKRIINYASPLRAWRRRLA